MKRRKFIKESLAVSTLISSGIGLSCNTSKEKLNILVLGGTFFVGPAIVNAALRNNHEITLFNRGITNPKLFPNVKLIRGDRELGRKAYEPLIKEKWDIIIDVWPEKSVLVDEAVSALVNQTKHYIFISSLAVYHNFQEVGLHEESEVVSLELSEQEWSYAEEKLAAENVVRSYFPDNHTILRPGPIKGWRDPAYDLLYWCVKLNRDDSIIAPGSGMDPIQFVDVNDVGRLAIMASENNHVGVYNCVGPMKEPLLWVDFLEKSKKHFNSQTELIWASEDFLAKNNVYSFSDLPLWAPLSEDQGFMQISNKKLCQTGFEFTPINTTLDDCMKWLEIDRDNQIEFGRNEVDVGLERSRELELIEVLNT